VLPPREASEVEAHLAACPDGRREVADLVGLRRALDEVPPEAFIDGPPPGGDLLLQRTLRKVREQEPPLQPARPSPVRRLAAVAAAVAVVGGVLAGGVIIGRGTVDEPSVALPGPGQEFVATDPGTGAKMDVKVEPLAGWVKVHAKVEGIKKGEPCLLMVTPKSGAPMMAGSWLVSPKGESEGTVLDGSALIDPKNVKSVDVVTTDGRSIVSVPITT
jgi:hypothetical protein